MKRSTVTRLLFAAETVLLTIIVVVAVQSFVAQPYRVEHESMLSTLHDGEMVLVDKLAPRLGGISRGHIIVFEPPPRTGDDGTPFIKRVIGLPGDLVELRAGVVHIDGIALDESGYIHENEPTLPTDSISRWQVPVGQLFVLGDHRADSTDSRVGWLGLVPMERVIGRAAVRYWPMEVAAVLDAPAYPELEAAAGRAVGQAGPATHASMLRP